MAAVTGGDVRTPDELLEAARAGDAAARDELVTRHLDTVRAVCGSRLRSPHDVADATQETFVRALARLDQVRDPESLGAWLRAIAARVCADHGRHVQRALVVADPVGETATEDPGPDELVLAGEEATRLHATLATLGKRDRQALWLRDAVGLPVAHVAADLGLTEGSARVLLARARTRLRTAYEGAAAVAAVGLLRVRGRLSGLGGLDARVAFAAQLAIVAVAIGAAVPGTRAPAAERPEPAPAAADHAVARTVAVSPGTSLHLREAGNATGGAAPAAAAVASEAPSADRPAPVVTVGTAPPEGPSRFGIATSDGDGEVAGIELWGGPVEEVLGAGGDGSADGDQGTSEEDGDDDSRLPLGPVEVFPGDADR